MTDIGRVDIEDRDELYRRLAPAQINDDGTVNSSAFKRGKVYDPSLSVDLARLTSAQESVDRAGRAGFGLGVLRTDYPRSLGFVVRHSPVEGNAAHSLIEGQNDKVKSRLLAQHTVVRQGVESRGPV